MDSESHCNRMVLTTTDGMTQSRTLGKTDHTRVKANREDFVSIAHLPVEILVEIFLLCKAYSRIDNLSGSWFRQWMQVTFVCRQWREIALQTSGLWTKFHVGVVDSLSLVRLALERSNGLPIAVSASSPAHYSVPFPPMFHTIPAILKESHRAKSLSLGPGFSHFFSSHLRDAMPLSMPQLDMLELVGDPGRHTAFHGKVLDIFNGVELPALRNLTLSNCFPRIRNTILAPTLTTLHISTVSDVLHDWPLGVSILTLISHLQLLHSLSLSLISLELIPPVIQEAVTFSSLRHLNIGGDISACALLLSYIFTPLHPTRVSATMDFGGNTNTVQLISGSFCRWLSGTRAIGIAHPDFLTCAITSHDNIKDPRKEFSSRVSCHLWADTLQFDAPEVPRPFFQLDTFTNSCQLIALRIFSTFPLRSIQRLWICGLPFLGPRSSSMRELFDLLAAMPNVTELCVYNDGSGVATSNLKWIEIIAVAGLPDPDANLWAENESDEEPLEPDPDWEPPAQGTARPDSPSHPLAITLPKLSVLLLKGLVFRLSSYHYNLLDALRERHDAGVAIDELVIAQCLGVRKCHIVDLRPVIGSVDWDGVSLEPT